MLVPWLKTLMHGSRSPLPYLIPSRYLIYFLFLQKPTMASGIVYFGYFDIMVLTLNKLDHCLVYAFSFTVLQFLFLKVNMAPAWLRSWPTITSQGLSMQKTTNSLLWNGKRQNMTYCSGRKMICHKLFVRGKVQLQLLIGAYPSWCSHPIDLTIPCCHSWLKFV